MNILVVALYDDNFGDMLIRTCFTQLLRVVLKNVGAEEVSIGFLSLREAEEERLRSADLIIFPGGGLFGLSYLGFAEHVERVIAFADEHDIPVVFSSLGMNNMDATEEDRSRLSSLLRRKCIRAFSVREKAEVFRYYAAGADYTIREVCDPAVWAGTVYAADLPARDQSSPVIGVNVVRGGLFRSNDTSWALADEEAYLYDLSQRLDALGLEYRFFTNGSTLDNNVLRHFSEKYAIPQERLIYVDTARELVQAAAGFDAVAAIRMHASIVSYALGVPALNLVWNVKIPDFYEKIGHPDRAVKLEDWSAETVADRLKEMLTEGVGAPDPAVLMTLYTFLYDTVKDLMGIGADIPAYSYRNVCEALRGMQVPLSEDEGDLRFKVRRGEIRYAGLFTSDLARKAEMRELKKADKQLKKANLTLEKQLKAAEKARQKAESDLQKSEKKRASMQRELDYLNSRLVIRIYRKLAGMFARLRKRA